MAIPSKAEMQTISEASSAYLKAGSGYVEKSPEVIRDALLQLQSRYGEDQGQVGIAIHNALGSALGIVENAIETQQPYTLGGLSDYLPDAYKGAGLRRTAGYQAPTGTLGAPYPSQASAGRSR